MSFPERVLVTAALPLLTLVFPIGLFAQEDRLGGTADVTVAEDQPGTAQAISAQWHEVFASTVRPIFEARCFDCHGPDSHESGLQLHSLNAIRKGGDSGEPAILPADTNRSHMFHLITTSDPNERMPPDGEPLSEGEIAAIESWIKTAPPWKSTLSETSIDHEELDHWSFKPLTSPSVPHSLDAIANTSPDVSLNTTANPIDCFIQLRLAEQGLTHNPIASKRILIRRLYLDLLGIPPTASQVESFENDRSVDAYERLVDSLLANPAYGERWGRYWLDLVRFAETDGYETNRERPNAWPFRDYVIESLNNDKPFDQFLREQLAGDQMGVPVATGYLVAGTRDIVKSPDIVLTKTQRQNELDDMINTTGTAMLGLTLGCARCHNHKFDPVTQSDYYALQAVFTGVQHGERQLPLSNERRQRIEQLKSSIEEVEGRLAGFKSDADSVRPAVVFTKNTETFQPTKARFLKFTVLETTGAEPCIDELEVFANDQNVALATLGTKVESSGNLPGFPIHQLAHINDGKYGNEFSWISNSSGTGWVKLSFPQVVEIDGIAWGRDRNGRYSDRLATKYKIEVSTDHEHWNVIASSDDRLPFGQETPSVKYDFDQLPPAEKAFWEKQLDQLQMLKRQLEELQKTPSVYAGNFSTPEPTFRLFRGDPMAAREQVDPNTVEFLGDLQLDESATDAQRRVSLAEWITDVKNPLTARVIVNRLWQHHFGNGFVPTPSDFGKAGVEPSHPQLLDYLANTLLENKWSLKSIHREILLSATYQQSSEPNANAMEVDSGNKWLWRFAPRRLEAEAIRDSILAVTGVLDSSMGGPGFSAFEVELENVRHYHPKSNYGPDDWRRMIYMTKVRQEQDSVFGIFDCPDGSTTVPARNRSTTPLQSLNLFNSPFMLQQAKILADSLVRETNENLESQIVMAYWRCYSRSPQREEIELAEKFVAEYGLEAFCRAMLNSNEFLFIQ